MEDFDIVVMRAEWPTPDDGSDTIFTIVAQTNDPAKAIEAASAAAEYQPESGWEFDIRIDVWYEEDQITETYTWPALPTEWKA